MYLHLLIFQRDVARESENLSEERVTYHPGSDESMAPLPFSFIERNTIKVTLFSSMKALYLEFLVVTLSQLLWANSQASYGSIQLYTNGDCTQPESTAIRLEVNACLEINQSSAIAALSFPSCGNLRTILDISDQSNCRNPSFWPPISSGNVGDCLSLVTGSGIGSAAFVCVGEVTTVSSAPTGQGTSVPSVQPDQTVSPSASSSILSPALPSQSPSPSGGGSSRSDEANVAIGVTIGLAALFVAIWGVWYARRSYQLQTLPQNIRWASSHRGPDPPPPYREFELYRRQR